MAISKDTKEILRGGISLVGRGFDVAAFEVGVNAGDVSNAIAAAEIVGLTSDVTVTEELEFEVSEFDGKPGRTEGDSTPRKADIRVAVTMKQMAAELLEKIYTTAGIEAVGDLTTFDKVTRELDPATYDYQTNVFIIGKRKDKKLFILVIDSGASESPFSLEFSDGEDVMHTAEVFSNYKLDDIRDNLDGAVQPPYKLYIEKTA